MTRFIRKADHVVFASYGNDSIALIQLAFEKKLNNVIVVYSDTGWSGDFWKERVEKAEKWVDELGFRHYRTQSEGMMDLVRRKNGWPRSGIQFCTQHLKIEPAQEFLDLVDPDYETTCMVGVRREESLSRRNWPEWIEESEKHNGRSLWSPLVRYDIKMRDRLIRKTGFETLKHRSLECYPCVNAGRKELKELTEERIDFIEKFEYELGYTKNGNLRTMFRPASKGYAIGIKEVIKWAYSERGKYDPLEDMNGGCDSGFCGT